MSLCFCAARDERAVFILNELIGIFRRTMRREEMRLQNRRGSAHEERPLGHGRRKNNLAVPNGRARGNLRGGEVMPHVARGLNLEDATFIRVKEVSSVRNPMVCRRLHRAARPMGRADSPTMLLDLGHEVDSILHTILDTGRPGGY